LTLKGNIIASLDAALAISGLMSLVTKSKFMVIVGPSIGISVFWGVMLALLASLI
jgi:hypothetical protein